MQSKSRRVKLIERIVHDVLVWRVINEEYILLNGSTHNQLRTMVHYGAEDELSTSESKEFMGWQGPYKHLSSTWAAQIAERLLDNTVFYLRYTQDERPGFSP